MAVSVRNPIGKRFFRAECRNVTISSQAILNLWKLYMYAEAVQAETAVVAVVAHGLATYNHGRVNCKRITRKCKSIYGIGQRGWRIITFIRVAMHYISIFVSRRSVADSAADNHKSSALSVTDAVQTIIYKIVVAGSLYTRI